MKFLIGLLLIVVVQATEDIQKNCLQKSDGGPCRRRFLRWYFDQENGTCQPFIYGGCRGNGNRYETEEECLENCGRKECGENEHFDSCGTASPLTCSKFQNPQDFLIRMCVSGCQCDEGYVRSTDGKCVRPRQCWGNPIVDWNLNTQKNCVESPEEGPCKGLFFRWYFHQGRGNCKPFVYGGCRGNGNRYETEEECLENCRRVTNISDEYEDTQCEENEYFDSCGTACPLTCDNYRNPPEFCTYYCVIGCRCADGFVKAADERCVRAEDCPIKDEETS